MKTAGLPRSGGLYAARPDMPLTLIMGVEGSSPSALTKRNPCSIVTSCISGGPDFNRNYSLKPDLGVFLGALGIAAC
jgi:hypothetical protein